MIHSCQAPATRCSCAASSCLRSQSEGQLNDAAEPLRCTFCTLSPCLGIRFEGRSVEFATHPHHLGLQLPFGSGGVIPSSGHVVPVRTVFWGLRSSPPSTGADVILYINEPTCLERLGHSFPSKGQDNEYSGTTFKQTSRWHYSVFIMSSGGTSTGRQQQGGAVCILPPSGRFNSCPCGNTA